MKNNTLNNIIVHNQRLSQMMHPGYVANEVDKIFCFCMQEGTWNLPVLPSGLYPAAAVSENHFSGYQNVWVRDNVMIAWSLYLCGQSAQAIRCMQALMRFFISQKAKIRRIILNPLLAADPQNRPHIRFNGYTCHETEQSWPHAQNDALGYFLWLYCILAEKKLLKPGTDENSLLALLTEYFARIGFWCDEDSGHWEENRKISASSIGAVTAGLIQYRKHLMDREFVAEKEMLLKKTGHLINKGRTTLKEILPWECRQSSTLKKRKNDAALLFLIYPLKVVDAETESAILYNVRKNLQGHIGIRRYKGDSYYCADYPNLFDENVRSGNFSGNLSMRNRLLLPGQEAQWCLFDPLISVIYGNRYQNSGHFSHFHLQEYYFNRALAQLTPDQFPQGGMLCPESYYLDHGRYIPNPMTPLFWTQAMLRLAFEKMIQTHQNEKHQSRYTR